MEARRDPKAFLGIGWAFPFGLAADGEAATVRHEVDVEQAIRIILGTNPGERVMRPDFGAGLDDFLFEPITAGTLERVRRRVEEGEAVLLRRLLEPFEQRFHVARPHPRETVPGTLRHRPPGRQVAWHARDELGDDLRRAPRVERRTEARLHRSPSSK